MRTDQGTLANLLALGLAMAASVVLLVIPAYKSVRSSAVVEHDAEARTAVTTVSHTTLLQQNGPGVLLVLAVPVLITLMAFIPWRATRRLPWRLAPAILLTALCILAGFSIGLFYFPAALALWIAASLAPGKTRSPLDH